MDQVSNPGSNEDESNPDSSPPTKFQPIDHTQHPPTLQSLPDDEPWLTVLSTPCTFPPEIFHTVMLNLIKNPNITSSHLFRADIFYDSGDHGHPTGGKGNLARHLKPEYQPIDASAMPGYESTRTVVRQLVPRNPQLDRPLVQTCHFSQRLEQDDDVGEERHVVLYIPHVPDVDTMPFYHPAVSKLAFLHRWRHHNTPTPKPPTSSPPPPQGTLSLHYALFPRQPARITPKLSRTALRLLQTVHKHGQGQLAGYEKRVHLDQIIPQKRYQDTYTRLKARYGKQLAEQWVEVTDPGKHVFEDLGIAAFLVEVWGEMYGRRGEGVPGSESRGEGLQRKDGEGGGGEEGEEDIKGRTPFPGFVDIGCGNGILVYILLSEGYTGFGFDARERKTWSTFPAHIQRHLQQRLLVPDILTKAGSSSAPCKDSSNELHHPGVFAPGTFIISNHADELTAWTPLLAYLNKSSFIAIPCCSHSLSGARFRAPATTKAAAGAAASEANKRRHPKHDAGARLPQQEYHQPPTPSSDDKGSAVTPGKKTQAAETGSLKPTPAQKKMPSAYATLCSYVASLAEEVGFEAEREVLRIPSTRNSCIVGRRRRRLGPEMGECNGDGCDGGEGEHEAEGEEQNMRRRREEVIRIVETETGRSIDAVGQEWIARAEGLAKKPGSGH